MWHTWQLVDDDYPTHRAFYRDQPARAASSECWLGDDWDGWHLSYVLATGELYLGAPSGGPVTVVAVFPSERPQLVEALLAGAPDGAGRDWLSARLRPPAPSPRPRLSPLGA